MYQLLLCWRYLRTRWIALASIVSVTLGVATLIVVNSVMDGFTKEMHDRIHGILSDIVVQSHSTAGMGDPTPFVQSIRKRLGDRLQGVTTIVTVPAMLTFSREGQSHTQQINLIGIDTDSYASVSDFSRFLMHPENRKQLEFLLREDGYAPDRESLQWSGWHYRRARADMERQAADLEARNRMLREQIASLNQPTTREASGAQAISEEAFSEEAISEEADVGNRANFAPQSPEETPLAIPQELVPPVDLQPPPASSPGTEASLAAGPSIVPTTDSLGSYRFDPSKDVHAGLVLGVGIGSTRYRNAEGKVEDYFFIRPGDDVSLAFPGAGTPPRAIESMFTVVDMYESQMSEYDSTFAFTSIEQLQKLRGMFDPTTGVGSVNSIQIKLTPGTDLNWARDQLREAFPPMRTMVRVESWKDSQGPLLAAVQLETTILNILLFMIIAVAGFGILATFYMIVVEKTKDIGVLKSLGAPGGGIARIFLGYGLLLGAVGAGAGAILGLLFVWNINRIARMIEWITGREVFDPTVYYFTKIPTVIHPGMVVWVVLGSMLIAILASVLPSMRAARMHPVEALRYE
ncbi:MAG: ABC transporter permease [Pirellulaceae bacterium]